MNGRLLTPLIAFTRYAIIYTLVYYAARGVIFKLFMNEKKSRSQISLNAAHSRGGATSRLTRNRYSRAIEFSKSRLQRFTESPKEFLISQVYRIGEMQSTPSAQDNRDIISFRHDSRSFPPRPGALELPYNCAPSTCTRIRCVLCCVFIYIMTRVSAGILSFVPAVYMRADPSSAAINLSND